MKKEISSAARTPAATSSILDFGSNISLFSQLAPAAQHPGAVVLFHANAQVEIHGGRRRQQDDGGLGTQFRLGAADKLSADAMMLVAGAHGQVGEVAAIAPISKRARNTDQQATFPGGNYKIGFVQHLLHAG